MLRGFIVAAAIAALGIVPALAQSDDATPAAGDGDRIDFDYGRFTYELDPSVAINACIDATQSSLAGDAVTLRVFGRSVAGDTFEMLGTFETERTEDLGDHPIGFCVPMGEQS